MSDVANILQRIHRSTTTQQIIGLKELLVKLNTEALSIALLRSNIMHCLTRVLRDSEHLQILKLAVKALGKLIGSCIEARNNHTFLKRDITRNHVVESLIKQLTSNDVELTSLASHSLRDLAKKLDMKEQLQASTLPQAVLAMVVFVPERSALAKVATLLKHVYGNKFTPSRCRTLRKFHNSVLEMLWRMTMSKLPLPDFSSMLPLVRKALLNTKEPLKIFFACTVLKQCLQGKSRSEVSQNIVDFNIVRLLMTAIKRTLGNTARLLLECVGLLGKQQCNAILEEDFKEVLARALGRPYPVGEAACLAIQDILEGGRMAVQALEGTLLMREVSKLLISSDDHRVKKAALEATLVYITHGDREKVLSVQSDIIMFYRTARKLEQLDDFREVFWRFPEIMDKVSRDARSADKEE